MTINKIDDYLCQRDTRLFAIVKSITLSDLPVVNDLYLPLIKSVVSQQLSVKVADVIFGRFLALFEQKPEPKQVLNIPIERLRAVGLSFQKASYLQNIARFAQEHRLTAEVLHSLTDDEIVVHISQIKGVGRWTVEMLLIFSLNKQDVFPIDDLAIRQSMMRLYGIEDSKNLKKELTAIAEQWRPYRTFASRYLWKWKDAGYPALV